MSPSLWCSLCKAWAARKSESTVTFLTLRGWIRSWISDRILKRLSDWISDWISDQFSHRMSNQISDLRSDFETDLWLDLGSDIGSVLASDLGSDLNSDLGWVQQKSVEKIKKQVNCCIIGVNGKLFFRFSQFENREKELLWSASVYLLVQTANLKGATQLNWIAWGYAIYVTALVVNIFFRYIGG